MGLSLPLPLALAARADDFDLDAPVAAAKPPPTAYTNRFEIGTGYQSLNSYYFARYGGNPDKGPFLIVDGAAKGGDAWDSGGTRVWDASALVFGFDRLSFSAHMGNQGGNQGSWRVGLSYDSFTRFYSDTSKTPFDGAGTDVLTLPANWRSGASSLQFTNLTADLKPLDLSVHWQTLGGDFSLKPWSGYELKFHVEERHREGSRDQSTTFGPEANFPIGVFFPQPVDYDTSRITASFGYASPKFQWNGSYTLSSFRDALQSVTLPNPYSRSLGTPWIDGAFAGYPFAIGQYSTPPDSTAHQFLLTGAYNFSPTTRLTGRASYDIQTQNDPFLPYTPNTGLNVPTPLPQASLNGRVDKTFVSLGLTSRPLTDVDVAAHYSYDNRDNKTPQNIYSYVTNDTLDQPTPVVPGNSAHIRINLPHSFMFQQAKIEAGYRPAPRIRLSVDYTGDFKSYTDQEVSRTNEHTLHAKALASGDEMSGWVSYSYAVRTGTIYQDFLPWNLSHTGAYLAAGPQNQSIELAQLRKYNLADRRRNEVKAGGTYSPLQSLTVDLSGGYAADDYFHTPYGLTSTGSLLLDADVSYAFEAVTTTAFYSLERIRSAQNGYYLFTAVETDPTHAWSAQDHDTVHTAGIKVDWQAIAHKLKLGLNYTLSHGLTAIGVEGTAFTPSAATAPLPDARAITHSAGIKAEYTLKDNITLRGGYNFERHITDDWTYLGGLTPVAQLVGSGELPPRYTAHVVWVSARYGF